MDILIKLLAFAGIHIAATMSPGPAFAITVRNAVVYDRHAGLWTAIGLGLGLGIMAILVLGGMGVLIAQSVLLFNIVKYAGAAYLLFIGLKALFFSKKEAQESRTSETRSNTSKNKSISNFGAFRIGLLTNLLNPKGFVFSTAVYAQFITPGTGITVMGLFVLTSILIETLWFVGVSFILTNPVVKARFLSFKHWVERVCGGLLVALGVKLALSKA